uniref:ribosomal protein S1 n=1 Tax=Fibrocapsa japonica TaxID=94617 RepID=UPI0021140E43|nr:ribosomal protein S1 [Fibrocapsa japonica]UTE95244.1 ribosomal protein S1 [Fibrocapsa japonica]
MQIIFFSDLKFSNFNNLVKKHNYKFKVKNIVGGTVLVNEKQGSLIDIGSKKLAYLSERETQTQSNHAFEGILKVSESCEFCLVKYSKKDILISIREIKLFFLKQQLKELMKENVTVSGNLKRFTKNWKVVYALGLRGYIKNSSLPKYYRRKQRVNQKIPINVLNISEKEKKILFSCKLAYFNNQINLLKTRQTIIGCITRIKTYGIFVNIYGIKSFLHISEISTKKIKNLNDLFKIGNLIKVTVIYINLTQAKIVLSIKQIKGSRELLNR